MIRTIKNQLFLSFPRTVRNFCIIIGSGLFGAVLFEVIMRLEGVHSENPTTFEMSFLMGLLAYAVVELIYGIANTEQDFNHAVGMGITRKNFFAGYTLASLFNSFAGLAALLILCASERLRLKLWWSGYPCETDFLAVFTPALLCLLAVLLCILQEFVGLLLLRFGKKAFWAVWCIWMLGCLLVPRMADDIRDGKNSAFARLGVYLQTLYNSLSVTAWFLIAASIGLILFVITYQGFRRQKVTF